MTDRDKQPKIQTLFVLVKPDGYPNKNFIKSLMIDEMDGARTCNLQDDVYMTPEEVLKHYPKNTEWLKKYGSKICAARLKVKIEDVNSWDALLYGDTIMPALSSYMTSGIMSAMIFTYVSNKDCFDLARELLGPTDPSMATMETIRYRYSNDSFEKAWTGNSGPRAIRNVCHISDSQEEAYREACMILGKEKVHPFFSHLFPACEQAREEAVQLVTSGR